MNSSPRAMERRSRDRAVRLHPLDLVGEVFVAVVLEVAGKSCARAVDLDAPVWIDTIEPPAPAAEEAQLPIGVEVTMAMPTAEVMGHAVQLCGREIR